MILGDAPATRDPGACVGFADCPCLKCRATRVAATAAHPDHAHPSDVSYCGACRTADRHAHAVAR